MTRATSESPVGPWSRLAAAARLNLAGAMVAPSMTPRVDLGLADPDDGRDWLAGATPVSCSWAVQVAEQRASPASLGVVPHPCHTEWHGGVKTGHQR
jgi:hypothetical protein